MFVLCSAKNKVIDTGIGFEPHARAVGAEIEQIATAYDEKMTQISCTKSKFVLLNADDSTIVKQLVEQITVNDDGIEIQFKCGASIGKEYATA